MSGDNVMSCSCHVSCATTKLLHMRVPARGPGEGAGDAALGITSVSAWASSVLFSSEVFNLNTCGVTSVLNLRLNDRIQSLQKIPVFDT